MGIKKVQKWAKLKGGKKERKQTNIRYLSFEQFKIGKIKLK